MIQRFHVPIPNKAGAATPCRANQALSTKTGAPAAKRPLSVTKKKNKFHQLMCSLCIEQALSHRGPNRLAPQRPAGLIAQCGAHSLTACPFQLQMQNRCVHLHSETRVGGGGWGSPGGAPASPLSLHSHPKDVQGSPTPECQGTGKLAPKEMFSCHMARKQHKQEASKVGYLQIDQK